MPGEVVTIARFSDSLEAQLALNQLRDAGITATLAGENTPGLFSGMGPAFGAIQLQVDEENANRAVEILEAADDGELADEPDDPTAISERPTPRLETPPEEAIQAKRSKQPEKLTKKQRAAAEKLRRADDDDEPERAIRSGPDEMANRAWKASVIGVLCMTFGCSIWGGIGLLALAVQVYSMVLLLRLMMIDEDLSARAQRKVYGALAVNCAALGLFVVTVLQIFRR